MLFKKQAEIFVYYRGYDTLYLAITEFGLCLALKLGVRYPYTQDACQPFSYVFPCYGNIRILQHILILAVLIDRPCQRRLKTAQMRAAFYGVDIIHKAKYVLGIPVIILEGYFARNPFFFP